MADKPELKDSKIVATCSAPQAPLFSGHGSVLNLLTDSEGTKKGSNTISTSSAEQVLRPPVNFPEAIKLKDSSPHHAACITTKKNCIVGLGFVSDADKPKKANVDGMEPPEIASLLTGLPYVESSVDKALDERTLFGFSNELMDWVEDFLDTGSGCLEVAREGDNITYIGHIPIDSVRVVKQDKNIYFQVREKGGQDVYFSRFGDKDWLFEKGPYVDSQKNRDDVSEIIFLSEPTNRCKYYGYPSWLAASVDIDLLKKAKQYKADFYHNRGVLDYIVSVLGHNVDQKEWDKIQTNISGTSGEGGNFKNMALNFASETAKVQVDKLAADSGTEDQFATDNEVFSQNIVTAHGVPPLLANILIPGKLGASNEFINSMISFQLLRIGPAQQLVQKMLARTLGNSKLNGDITLTEEDFLLRTITSQINLTGLDTVGKMREEAPTADRDLDKGVKD